MGLTYLEKDPLTKQYRKSLPVNSILSVLSKLSMFKVSNWTNKIERKEIIHRFSIFNRSVIQGLSPSEEYDLKRVTFHSFKRRKIINVHA